MSETGNDGRGLFSIPEFLAFREQNHAFEDVVGYNNAVNISYNDGSGTREIFGSHGAESHAGSGGAYVTTNTFDYYGVFPLLGRGITQEDGNPGAPPVFVMNYRLWQEISTVIPAFLEKAFFSMARGEPWWASCLRGSNFMAQACGCRLCWIPDRLTFQKGSIL